jgi:hypothetical protein
MTKDVIKIESFFSLSNSAGFSYDGKAQKNKIRFATHAFRIQRYVAALYFQSTSLRKTYNFRFIQCTITGSGFSYDGKAQKNKIRFATHAFQDPPLCSCTLLSIHITAKNLNF